MGLKGLRATLQDIVKEERKIHDSIQKYKREESSGVLTDFEKMMIQYYVDVGELERQARGMCGEGPKKFDRYFSELQEILEIG